MRSEAIIQGRIQGKPPLNDMMVSPSSNQMGYKGVYAAKSLVNAKEGISVVRMMNPSDTIRRVRKGDMIAKAEYVDLVSQDSHKVLNGNDIAEFPEYLLQLYEDTCTREQLDAETRLSFRQMLIKHAAVFARNDSDLGRTDVVCHDIDTSKIRPIRQPSRRIPTTLQVSSNKKCKTWWIEVSLNRDITRGLLLSY